MSGGNTANPTSAKFQRGFSVLGDILGSGDTSVLVNNSLMAEKRRRESAVLVLCMQVCNMEHNIILSNQ